MPLQLDHVVILVPNLAQAITNYTALGFTVQPGGTHADGATHNALVVFADGSYLELIAFLRPHPQHRWGARAAQGYRGLVDFALLPPTVAEVVDRARAAGVDYTGPLDGGRTRPDGAVLCWQIGTPPSADLPFLCGDVTPRHLRVPEGAVRVHANGVQGIAAVTVQVQDLAASTRRYAALLGLATPPAPGGAGQAGPASQRLALGRGTVVLTAAGAGAATGQPPAEGLVGLTLLGRDSRSLPLAQTHGAVITVEPAPANADRSAPATPA